MFGLLRVSDATVVIGGHPFLLLLTSSYVVCHVREEVSAIVSPICGGLGCQIERETQQ